MDASALHPQSLPTLSVRAFSDRVLVWLFGVSAFLGAGLIFLVEPMVAKMVLPRLGGSPAVWNTSLLFFQGLLLVGYGYAHVSTKSLGLRRQSSMHVGLLLLPLLALPIAVPAWRPPERGSPIGWLLVLFLVTTGAPYLAVSTASPLLQRWFSGTSHDKAVDPYFLYAAGNAGSMAGLFAYPVLVEPHLALAQQGRLWEALYVAFAALSCVCVLALRARLVELPSPAAAVTATKALAERSAWRDRARWIVLGLVPSSVMMGATTHLSTDVASVPMMWVLPLGAYLLTFILVFGRRQVAVEPISRYCAYAVAFIAPTFAVGLELPLVAVVGLHLTVVFIVGLLCHGRLAAMRPSPHQLTEFFLFISLGGVLGGVFNSLIAPVSFSSIAEYPLILIAALFLRLHGSVNMATPRADSRQWLAYATDVVAAVAMFSVASYSATRSPKILLVAAIVMPLVFRSNPRRFAFAIGAVLLFGVLHAETDGLLHVRTFFGTMRITEKDGYRTLLHGTTTHGMQSLDPSRRRQPLAYYDRRGPVGQTFAAFAGDPRFNDVGIVGLGVGTFAAYERPGQHFTFFEIDPEVYKIANNTRYFTYLHDARGRTDFVFGDARLRLADQSDRSYGVLALDAFSSDSIPIHLMTVQAWEMYLQKLRPNGLLMVHISNRSLNLEPQVAALAKATGLQARILTDNPPAAAILDGEAAADWVVLSRSEADLHRLDPHAGWRRLRSRAAMKAWTDDFSNLLEVVSFR